MHGEDDHLARHIEEIGLEASDQGHRPFGEAGVLNHQPLVRQKAQADLVRCCFRALPDDPLALVLVDDYVAGTQLLDIVGSTTDRNWAGVVETVADGTCAGRDAVHFDRNDILSQNRDDAMQRAHPAQAPVTPTH